MRLVEEVVSVDPGQQAIARRVTRVDDFYFEGHFPGQPVVPAIVLIELLAQTGGLAAGAPKPGEPHQPRALRVAAVDGFRFPAGCGAGVTLEATAKVAEFLFRKATTEGPQCVTAAIFWMKTRGGWRETPQAHEVAFKPASEMTDAELEARIRELDTALGRPIIELQPAPNAPAPTIKTHRRGDAGAASTTDPCTLATGSQPCCRA